MSTFTPETHIELAESASVPCRRVDRQILGESLTSTFSLKKIENGKIGI
jgi:hypothetical protein